MRSLLIRADASSEVGTGHVMRTIALAQAWRRRGGQARFLCSRCPESLRRRVEASGFPLTCLAVEPGGEEDRAALLREIAADPQSRLVLDGYIFDREYQEAVCEAAERLLVLDDYGQWENYSADVLLNQNPHAAELKLRERIAADCVVLEGAMFALLREEFLTREVPQRQESRESLRVLVTLGGGDPDNVTLRVLYALREYAEAIAEIRVLCGAANPHLAELRAAAESSSVPVEVLRDVRDMPEQLAWADCAICAAGSTCWEMAYFGLPIACVVIADNQRPIAADLVRRGAVVGLGWHEDFEPEAAAGQLRGLLMDPDERIRLARNLGALVDGRGADRVAAALWGGLRVTVATAKGGWMAPLLDAFVSRLEAAGHEVGVVYDAASIPKGDVLFLFSFWSLLPQEVLGRNSHNVVVHESALPQGRGWSPVTWQVLEGQNEIPVVLFEAADSVDSGPIYLKGRMTLRGDELIDEIRAEQARVTFELGEAFLRSYPAIISAGREQTGKSTQYPRRGPEDSRLDPSLSLEQQFNLLRVVDNHAYPAFFEHAGRRYVLRISTEEKER